MHIFTMVGVGGTGTHLLRPLVTYLANTYEPQDWLLYLIDGDTVEPKNLTRQLFLPGAVSANKAVAAANEMNSGNIIPVSDYLSEENIARFIKDGDTVFICADNFTVRKRIEDHALTLPNVTIINGGNEDWSGSVQIFMRENGENVTPRLSYQHPEIKIGTNDDRSTMTCLQAAKLPGGTQLLIANAQAATWMLTALWRKDTGLIATTTPGKRSWHEFHFDLKTAENDTVDFRTSTYWKTA